MLMFLPHSFPFHSYSFHGLVNLSMVGFCFLLLSLPVFFQLFYLVEILDIFAIFLFLVNISLFLGSFPISLVFLCNLGISQLVLGIGI